MTTRPAIPADETAIRSVNVVAFGHGAEAELVESLRADGDAAIELVSLRNSEVAGHIMFSPLTLSPEPDNAPRLLALAPMSVGPDWQRSGVGGELIGEGLKRARAEGWDAVIVLGHPDYYPRFGFSASAAGVLDSPFEDAGQALMALELTPGALARATGRLTYAKAFGIG